MTNTPDRTFLTRADVPPNLLRVRADALPNREGEVLTILRPRRVVRVGYRLCAADVFEDIFRVVRRAPRERLITMSEDPPYVAIATAAADLLAHAGLPVEKARLSPRDLANFLARTYVESQRFGGHDRGIWVQDVSSWLPLRVRVRSKRTVYVGERVPPSFSRDYWTGDVDADSGGLAHSRAVVLLGTDHGELISGDCSRELPTGEQELTHYESIRKAEISW